MTVREIELRELEAICKLKYGFLHDSRKKVLAEELLRAHRDIIDTELERITEIADNNPYKALYKLVVSELLGLNP